MPQSRRVLRGVRWCCLRRLLPGAQRGAAARLQLCLLEACHGSLGLSCHGLTWRAGSACGCRACAVRLSQKSQNVARTAPPSLCPPSPCPSTSRPLCGRPRSCRQRTWMHCNQAALAKRWDDVCAAPSDAWRFHARIRGWVPGCQRDSPPSTCTLTDTPLTRFWPPPLRQGYAQKGYNPGKGKR